MAETLFPVIDVPDLVDDDGLYDTKYRYSTAWDFEQGDFVRDGANKIPQCTGEEAYMIWCIKAVSTERYTCFAYDDDIGSELEEVFRETDREAAKSMIKRTITETLLVNPRTEYVDGFSFTSEADQIHCRFSVKGINVDEFAINGTIGGDGDARFSIA